MMPHVPHMDSVGRKLTQGGTPRTAGARYGGIIIGFIDGGIRGDDSQVGVGARVERYRGVAPRNEAVATLLCSNSNVRNRTRERGVG